VEIEKSVMAVLAGKQAQNRLTRVFRQERWAGHPASYALELELDGSTWDDAIVRELLDHHLPLREGETPASAYVSLVDRTQKLLDDNWLAVKAIARAVLKTKHYSLNGKMITTIVNNSMKSNYRALQGCHNIGD